MAIMEVVLTQQYAGQEIVNRWNYRSTGTPAAVSLSFALAQRFGGVVGEGDTIFLAGTVMGQLQSMQVADVIFSQLSVRNVYSVTDFYETPYSGIIGENAGGGQSPFEAFGFRTSRSRLDIRRGTKRFVGLPTLAVGTTPGALASGFTILMNTLAGIMSQSLVYTDEGQNITFDPVVCGKQRYEVPNSNPPRFAYRYYQAPNGDPAASQALQEQFVMDSIVWQSYNTIRTQTSRQFGRGR